MRRTLLGLLFLVFSVMACVRSQPEVIVITATFPAAGATPTLPLAVVPQTTPTPDLPRGSNPVIPVSEYMVQPGDTLSSIARNYGLSIEALLSVNDIPNPNALVVGQVIRLPEAPTEQTSSFKIIPDSRMVRAPGSSAFNVAQFVAQQPGYIRIATDEVKNEILTGADIVERVSIEYSVDARLLLALLEFKGGWLTNPNPSDDVKIYPLRAEASPLGFDRNGLYRQLTWAADQLNFGYYGWKLRGLTTLEFEDGIRLAYNTGLNAGTVALQHVLAQFNDYFTWESQVGSEGFYSTYTAYFGDPFASVIDPLVPADLTQPLLSLPFGRGQTWFYTGGPHGGWGSGSAWSAVDFAPPDERPEGGSSCYISDYFATAAAPGVIARSGDGAVVLDLDFDGDETTGWTIFYLHLATQDRIAVGTQVEVGDRIGRPSCEGGFSNGTHLHIARRYNGEWIPVDCYACPPGYERPAFVMGNWTMVGYLNQEYQGYMTNGSEERNAEQGRLDPRNRVTA